MLTITATDLHRVMNCNGSRLMPATAIATISDTTQRDEGTAAHWFAQQWASGVQIGEGARAPNGVIITDEMINFTNEYLSALDFGAIEIDTSFGNSVWRVNGRADHMRYRDGRLTVDDFKYGWRIVEPFMNWTLIAHAVGYCHINGIVPDTVAFRIHQPRPHHRLGKLREWVITGDQLNELTAQIDSTLSEPCDELRTGLSWCAKCPARFDCPAADAAAMNAVDAVTSVDIDRLEGAALSTQIDTLRLASATIDARLSALEDLATHTLKNGGILPNYALEAQYANTRWLPGLTPEFLTMTTGVDCTKPGSITPAEFKRRGGAQSVFDALTDRPMTGLKLVRATADERAKKLLQKGK